MSDGRVKVAQQFDSVDDVLLFLEENIVADEVRERYPLHAKYEYLWASDGSLIPSMCQPFVSPFIYRGQVSRHSPCLPSVFRGLSKEADPVRGWESLSPSDRAKLFVERVRLEEFLLALQDHPASAYAREIGLRMQPFGLAQHYEMATDRLDLTQDHHVAAFFATNQRVGGEWVPVEEGMGVIYRIHTESFFRNRPKHFECVGKQFLSRPEQQKAFTLTLPLVCDFESLPVEIFTFRQDRLSALRLNDRFSGGLSLFPPDVMADVASEIRSEESISHQVAEGLLSYDKPTRAYLADSVTGYKALVRGRSASRVSARERITLSESQLEIAASAVERMRSTFLNGVGAIAVRDVGGKPFEYCCLATGQRWLAPFGDGTGE